MSPDETAACERWLQVRGPNEHYPHGGVYRRSSDSFEREAAQRAGDVPRGFAYEYEPGCAWSPTDIRRRNRLAPLTALSMTAYPYSGAGWTRGNDVFQRTATSRRGSS